MGDLPPLKQTAKPLAGKCFCDSQDDLANILGSRSFGGRRRSRQMSLDARLSGGQCALLLGFRPARGTSNGQNMPQCKVFGLHTRLFNMQDHEDVQLCSFEVCKGAPPADFPAADFVTPKLIRGFSAYDSEQAGDQQDREADGGDAVGAD